MKGRVDDGKTAFTIRVPPLVNKRLAEKAERIGISKNSVILNLLYNEFVEGREERQGNNNYSM